MYILQQNTIYSIAGRKLGLKEIIWLLCCFSENYFDDAVILGHTNCKYAQADKKKYCLFCRVLGDYYMLCCTVEVLVIEVIDHFLLLESYLTVSWMLVC